MIVHAVTGASKVEQVAMKKGGVSHDLVKVCKRADRNGVRFVVG
jgi:hypothetical protein